jgi:metallophosphoesterase (TIGR00282 family)
MPDRVVILFLADIVGRPGRTALQKLLPGLVAKYDPSLIVANAENAAGGLGLTEEIGRDLLGVVDVLTSGNHIWDKKESWDFLDREPRLLRPANYPPGTPGRGDIVRTDRKGHTVAVINLQGRVFMDAIDCPFRTADAQLERIRPKTPVIVVDFHAEATSEKQALGWYLDGRVTAVLGTHTHVPTADDRILPGGTAFICDVGMVGSRDSVIGMKREQAIDKFLTSLPQRFEPARGDLILCAAVVEADASTGRALSVTREIIKGDDSDD